MEPRKRFQLRHLYIDRVDHVDLGANQHADIVLYKGLTRREFFQLLFKNRGSAHAAGGPLPSSRPTGEPTPNLLPRRQEVLNTLARHLRK